MNPKYSPFFESLTLKSGIPLKNRIVLAPMTTLSGNEDGTVSDAELRYYARRSKGVGIAVTACTYVTPNGKGFSGEFAAYSDAFIPSLQRLATTIKEQGAKAILQIFHGGRECPPDFVPNGVVVSASAVPSERNAAVVPQALTDDEVAGIVKDFGETTRRAIEAGFDGVEIHGANGYLIQQFFSPHSNRREDRWGGSVEGRLAFPLAVVDEVKRVVAEHAKAPFAVGYRFSPEEAEEPGITMAETFVLVDALVEKNLDYLHVSLNDFWSKPRRGVEDTSRSRIELILERVGNKVPVIGVGSLYTPDDVAKAMQTGVPLIALGRELVVEPEWVEKVAEGREANIATTLTRDDQEKLSIPDQMWGMIVHTPGWFPLV
ncbi:NADH-dependent flavin oxidoreductase [Brevibacillus fluminis]|uniref:NADH-dependent flavin oxidoreductase n=1 Tax=Brevibacillus fluminis TaxID=511487 RepID=A0A3M8CW25_9BACL|nr:NADH-dependent flavin oxidoreductase [Brevibacillus fluminis]RNB79719.1 NADH-dependent flavin oxidoreductase [Brevibacillus fluminis]